jgi:hypothetical protein
MSTAPTDTVERERRPSGEVGPQTSTYHSEADMLLLRSLYEATAGRLLGGGHERRTVDGGRSDLPRVSGSTTRTPDWSSAFTAR